MKDLNELALFAGAGGGILGTHLLGARPVCAVEIEPYCREILLRRQDEGHLPPFPVWDDARTFDGEPWRGLVDVVTGGFPCQPFSQAGKGLAENDPRNLWPETIRIIREVEPTFCLLENVPGLVSKTYFEEILGQLSEAGYWYQWDVISAAEVGANHIRKRLWILAYTPDARFRAWQAREAIATRNQTRMQEPQRCSGRLNASNANGLRPPDLEIEAQEGERDIARSCNGSNSDSNRRNKVEPEARVGAEGSRFVSPAEQPSSIPYAEGQGRKSSGGERPKELAGLRICQPRLVGS